MQMWCTYGPAVSKATLGVFANQHQLLLNSREQYCRSGEELVWEQEEPGKP